MGDPVELRIHGYELTIRLADAAQIEVSSIHSVSLIRLIKLQLIVYQKALIVMI